MENILGDVSSTTTVKLPPSPTPGPTNCSAWDQQWGAPYLHRLAHLDPQLYQDYYAVWLSLLVSNCLMLVIGVVLNSLALYVFCGASTQSSAPVVYTINLAIADLLVALSLSARIALYHSGGSCLACSYVHTFSYFVNMYCSILFLTSICIDRYLAVVHASGTLHRWRTAGAARCLSALVWFIAVVVTYSFQTAALEFGTSCVLLPALFYLTVLEFLLPLLAVVGFTLRVACFLSSAPSGRGHAPMPRQSLERRARAVRLLATVLVVFTVCFTPFHVRQALVYFRVRGGGGGGARGGGGGEGEEGPGKEAGQVLAYHVTVTLSSLNSCLDPVVYCFVTDSFKRLWRRRMRTAGGSTVAIGGGGGGGEMPSVKKCSGTAMALAQSVATLTLASVPGPSPASSNLAREHST
ncbi:G-protein coupled receptor 20 [Gadus chalcogrammus]|uniref:G-protein coupled receptor 20 n=1 Tax=Gadus chalcogrammus TaxID=1042646 RepID=UPI0024C47E02|nr:G-protein coupled receptor 20 [Gadus chalcogrammus]